MIDRALAKAVENLAFVGRKIALVSGPRQCGKTTLGRMLLRRRKAGTYHNWDEVGFRRAWTRNPSLVVPRAEGPSVPLLVLDEIHKDHRWKRSLKGVYDTAESRCDILVTGSARLNVFRKGSDSLLGRHFHFRLHPLSLREMDRPDVLRPDDAIEAIFSGGGTPGRGTGARLASLLAYGPFPEPLLAQDERRARLWRRSREQVVVREDLRDLSRLPELGRVEMMTALMPEKVGSLFSLASIGRDLEVSIPTVRRWLAYLNQLYYCFQIKPYSRRVARSLRRDGKLYLWDFAGVPDAPARFENLVAFHLLKACDYWTDTGEGTFNLHFLRDKEKREIDFLIVRDGEPWLPVEVKSGDTNPSPNWTRFAGALPCRRGVQLVRRPHRRVHAMGPMQVLVSGAAEMLSCLV